MVETKSKHCRTLKGSFSFRHRSSGTQLKFKFWRRKDFRTSQIIHRTEDDVFDIYFSDIKRTPTLWVQFVCSLPLRVYLKVNHVTVRGFKLGIVYVTRKVNYSFVVNRTSRQCDCTIDIRHQKSNWDDLHSKLTVKETYSHLIKVL